MHVYRARQTSPSPGIHFTTFRLGLAQRSFFEQVLAAPFDRIAQRLDLSDANYDESERSFALLQAMLPIHIIKQRISCVAMLMSLLLTTFGLRGVLIGIAEWADRTSRHNHLVVVLALVGSFCVIAVVLYVVIAVVWTLTYRREQEMYARQFLAVHDEAPATFDEDMKRVIEQDPDFFNGSFVEYLNFVLERVQQTPTRPS